MAEKKTVIVLTIDHYGSSCGNGSESSCNMSNIIPRCFVYNQACSNILKNISDFGSIEN